MSMTASKQPSRGRWYILGIICLMYLITYLDRVNISTAAPAISAEFGFDKITMGWIFSAFFWAYALFQVPGGWLSDRYGARTVLTAVVAFWSVMTAATALATGFASFIVVRFLFGIGEAGAFPSATRAMQLWYPRHERGLVQGLTHSASRFGAAVAPPIVVLIIGGGYLSLFGGSLEVSFPALGWRSVFYIFAVAGLVWALWWYLSYRNLPEQHGLVNAAELAVIRGVDDHGRTRDAAIETRATVPWPTLLRSGNMWAIMLAYFTYIYCLGFFLTWLPSYLVEARHFDLIKVGVLASLPLFAGVIGDTAGGIATDWLLHRTGNTRLARRSVAIAGLLGCAALIVPASLTADPYTAVACLTGAMFFLECTIGPSWAVTMDTSGRFSGTVSGLMNMFGNFGAAISPVAFAYLAQHFNWQVPFLVTAVLLIAGAAVWAFWLDPERSCVDDVETTVRPELASTATV